MRVSSQLGYARVSTNEQDTAAQVSALKSAGCEKIFREEASGGRWDQPELNRLLDQLRKSACRICGLNTFRHWSRMAFSLAFHLDVVLTAAEARL
jgi:DNA invertase Pin-like site-specific DNA recombinase